MNKLTLALVTSAMLFTAALQSAPARAEGDDNIRLVPAPIHRLDDESLQRGARNFVNYCLSCHTAKYMRYNRLTDLGLTESQIKTNLIFGDAKVGDTMTVAMTADEARSWFGAAPPDLSVEARVRGVDWLYNYFLGFYRDDKSTTGWNNLVFDKVAMPHVLWQLQGTRVLKDTEYDDYAKAKAAAVAAHGLVALDETTGGKWKLTTFDTETPGTLTEVQYEGFVADLVNYLDYMAEPAKNHRIQLGIAVLLFLVVLFILVYLLKRNYWRSLH
jgi:ubiquinol-cytochrome c reductase cytochrome c1 subunit